MRTVSEIQQAYADVDRLADWFRSALGIHEITARHAATELLESGLMRMVPAPQVDPPLKGQISIDDLV